MSYVGDFSLGSTFDVKFTTVNTSGVPTTLAGTPVISAYPDNSLTELTAGITLSVDFDGRTGMHNIRVVATSGNGYAAGSNYSLVITTGTVGGNSVVGYVVGEFSIEARSAVRPTTAGRTLDVSAGGEAGLDWANIGSPTTAQNLSGTTVKTATDVETDTVDIQNRLPAALVGGRMSSDVGSVSGDATAADTLELFIESLNQVTGQIDNGTLHTELDTYQGRTELLDDDGSGNDRYAHSWIRNGELLASGITSPTIQVIKAADATDLVALTAMTEIGALGHFRYNEPTNRIVDGALYLILCRATIGGATHTWPTWIGRDSSV